MKYLVIIEQTPEGYGAWLPDLPGCIALGATLKQVLALMEEAIDLHVQSMVRDGETVPLPSARVALIEVDLASHRQPGQPARDSSAG